MLNRVLLSIAYASGATRPPLTVLVLFLSALFFLFFLRSSSSDPPSFILLCWFTIQANTPEEGSSNLQRRLRKSDATYLTRSPLGQGSSLVCCTRCLSLAWIFTTQRSAFVDPATEETNCALQGVQVHLQRPCKRDRPCIPATRSYFTSL